MFSQINDNMFWAYLTGVFDRRAILHIERARTSLSANFNIVFVSKHKADFYQQFFKGTVSKIPSGGIGRRACSYILRLKTEDIYALIPKLQPYTLKRELEFFVKFKNTAHIKVIKDRNEAKKSIYNEFIEYRFGPSKQTTSKELL